MASGRNLPGSQVLRPEAVLHNIGYTLGPLVSGHLEASDHVSLAVVTTSILPLPTSFYAIVFPGRIAGFRAGFWPDSSREIVNICAPAGKRPAGEPILKLCRSPISGPEALLRNIWLCLLKGSRFWNGASPIIVTWSVSSDLVESVLYLVEF